MRALDLLRRTYWLEVINYPIELTSHDSQTKYNANRLLVKIKIGFLTVMSNVKQQLYVIFI